MIILPIILFLDYNQYFADFKHTLLSEKFRYQIWILFSITDIREKLLDYSRFYTIFVVTLMNISIFLTQNIFYHVEFDLGEVLHAVIPSLILTSIFIFSKQKHFTELRQNTVHSLIFDSLFMLNSCYSTFFDFKNLYIGTAILKTPANFSLYLFIKNIIVNGLANMNAAFPLYLTLYFLSKRNSKHLFRIIKIYTFYGIVTTFCFLVYNPLICNFIYSKVNGFFPFPHNIILYNILPNHDTRYRMIVISIMWIMF